MKKSGPEELSFLASLALIVEKYPELTAISELGGIKLTYKELWTKSLNLSETLKKLGCRKNDLVAIQIEKSSNFVVSLVGTWMANCSFMVIDSTQPNLRIEEICSEAKPKHLLLTRSNIPLWNNASIVYVDDVSATSIKYRSLREPHSLLKDSVNFDDIAYLLFTSGSSGRPKGVKVAHSGINDVLKEQVKTFHLQPGKKSLWLHSIAFDASISDIGTALISGAELCIIPNYVPTSARELTNYIKLLQINFIDIPPAILQWMNPSDSPSCLETLVVGGEVCSIDALKSWARSKRVIVVYGPTEATICTSMIVVDPIRWSINGIGYPIPHVEYVIDTDKGELKDEGELLIGGKGLALGYLNRPELEQDKFIKFDGKRYYRTGDLVRRHKDSSFEFLGRTDRQLKINGKLVAPEEIEQCLQHHPLVCRAAIIPDARGNLTRMIAYCESPSDMSAINAKSFQSEIRNYLKQKFPSWMIPAKVSHLEKLPLNKNQKIDLKKLSSLAKTHNFDAYHVSENFLESKLHKIFSEVLECSAIDTEADIFDLGIDSMGVVIILCMAESEDIPLTAEILYRFKSINNVVSHLQTHMESLSSVHSQELTMEAEKQLALINVSKEDGNTSTSEQFQILVTGTTGFFGSYILWELLRQSSHIIHCLVRDTPNIGKDRINKAIKQHGLYFDDNDWKRIKIFTGDLEKDHLGLSSSDWSHYTNAIDFIYHCAASVSIVKPYEELKASNVEGTRRIIQLVTQGKRKALHYVSTLSVFVDALPKASNCLESDNLSNDVEVYGGYAQSKWVAEKMLQLFSPHLSKLSIYRLGLLTGKIDKGTAPKQDWFSLILAGKGNFEEHSLVEEQFDFTPVDYAAKALVYISLNSQKAFGTFHIANSNPVSAKLLAKVMQNDERSKALPSKGLSSSTEGSELHNPRTLFKRTNTDFDMFNTNKILLDANIEVPTVDFEYLKQYRKMVIENN
jgi:amino acid adenylation domain-containing protein/thioester reductase-like protein